MYASDRDEGMVKLTYSSDVPPAVGAEMRLIEDPGSRLIKKAADTIFGCDYETLRPDKDHVGIHTIALGDSERYPMNRNGDLFPKLACERYHVTFVKNGHVFRNHDNRDPEKSIGKIVKSAYNEPMGRIELFLHVHKDKAQPELHKLATDGTHAFSMACKVPYDRCTVCGTLRKSAADKRQCEHIRDHLGETWANGQAVGTYNDTPTWFDESFVGRPADRIAWDLKVASSGPISSIKQAESAGIWVPDHLELDIPRYAEKLALVQKLAEMEGRYAAMAANSPKTNAERYLWELRKAAATRLDSGFVQELRKYTPDVALAKLASAGIIMDPETFFKYAMGEGFGALKDEMPAILRDTHAGLFTRLYKSAGYQRACRNRYFDVDADKVSAYSDYQSSELSRLVFGQAMTNAFTKTSADARIVELTICGGQPTVSMVEWNKCAQENLSIHRGAELYAAYKLSALDAMGGCHRDNNEALVALAAVQNLVV